MLLTTIVFLVILSILVLVHEFGHFIVGKAMGMGVLEFAMGLPFTVPIWSKRLRGGMKLSLYPLLFGGFVRLKGEEGEESKSVTQSPSNSIKGKYFYKSSVWARIAVVVAGVVMNFLLAVAVFQIFLWVSNFKVLVPKMADYRFLSPTHNLVVVTGVAADSPAKSADLVFGDLIYSADGQNFSQISDFQRYVSAHSGTKVQLVVYDEDFSNSRVVTVVPRQNPPKGQGPLGLGVGDGVVLDFRAGRTLTAGLTYTIDMLFYSLKVLGGLVFHAYQTGNATEVTENVSGPVGIARLVGDILSVGGIQAAKGLLNLLGLLSVSLAFMNVLPVPALDGGKLAFLLVEAFFGKKMATQRENLINQIGFAILFGLIILVTYNDVKKIFGP